MTSFGHADVFLDPHWLMMGAREALNGRQIVGLCDHESPRNTRSLSGGPARLGPPSDEPGDDAEDGDRGSA
jgi:hypothetical protein